MADEHLVSIATHFGHLTDPRVERTRAHNLLDILTIAICAILAGADGPTSMETFGKAKEEWLRTILPLPNGIPSHDTFSRVLAHLKPTELQQGFLAWFAAIATATNGNWSRSTARPCANRRPRPGARPPSRWSVRGPAPTD